MKCNSNWKPFKLNTLFDIHPTKAYISLSKEELNDGGSVPFVVNSADNNGVGGFSSLEATEKGGIITFSDTTNGDTFFYQPRDFIGFAHVQGMYPINRIWNKNELLFIVTLLRFVNVERYNYGRKMTRENISNTFIHLPVDDEEEIDFDFINTFMGNIENDQRGSKRSIIDSFGTQNTTYANLPLLEIDKWGDFCIEDIFTVKYGVNLEVANCEETKMDDPDAINFVSRIEGNNGVSTYIKKLEIVPPQDANVITCAGGGSVLSTFLQKDPFYSGRDLYLLVPKDSSMSNLAKLFIITVLKFNRYKYNYGRQANKTLATLRLKLPVDCNGDLDYQSMESYIKSLPYGDRI